MMKKGPLEISVKFSFKRGVPDSEQSWGWQFSWNHIKKKPTIIPSVFQLCETYCKCCHRLDCYCLSHPKGLFWKKRKEPSWLNVGRVIYKREFKIKIKGKGRRLVVIVRNTNTDKCVSSRPSLEPALGTRQLVGSPPLMVTFSQWVSHQSPSFRALEHTHI